MIVDRAIYRDGTRTDAPETLSQLHDACSTGDGMAWLGLYRPDPAEFAEIAQLFDLHPLAVEDAVHAHQRPKLERYGDSSYPHFAMPSVHPAAFDPSAVLGSGQHPADTDHDHDHGHRHIRMAVGGRVIERELIDLGQHPTSSKLT